ncbi:MAG: hotdog fold thioesterase [Labilithrix sp.]|nr:hotdog fold thioesterase [Labilithrix sp.]
MHPDVLKQVMEELIPFNRYLGVKCAEAKKGFARLEVPFRDELVGDPLRPALHGGVLSALADAAGGAAVWTDIEDERARVSTIDLRIDYLRPARLVTLIAEATVVRLGNRVGVADVRMFNADAESETIATGKGVYNITIKKEPIA